MRTSILVIFISIFSMNLAIGQATENDAPVVKEQELKEQKGVIKKVRKQEKKAKKQEKKVQKEEKERKKEEKRVKRVNSLKKGIAKNEKKIVSLTEKLARGSEKGKLSPMDIKKMNSKISKLKMSITTDKEKLMKLRKRG
ncbi:hypothetical protein FB2170_10176 [Maribacter sp. HTCC2170]|nr:hypothetical protein FB2170_10176 [Maribacter sp. HTCC2170]